MVDLTFCSSWSDSLSQSSTARWRWDFKLDNSSFNSFSFFLHILYNIKGTNIYINLDFKYHSIYYLLCWNSFDKNWFKISLKSKTMPYFSYLDSSLASSMDSLISRIWSLSSLCLMSLKDLQMYQISFHQNLKSFSSTHKKAVMYIDGWSFWQGR